MPATKKQQTKLSLPKTRRHNKQLKKTKTVEDDSVVRIGGSSQKKKRHLEIHREGLDEVDKLLRDFDLNYAYGPCVGIKRIDRWERAKNLELNPPEFVKDSLVGPNASMYQESLFSQLRSI